MKKLWIFLLCLFIPLSASAKIKVVATLPIFGSLANAVGGERVEVKSLASPNRDPHFLDAKPSYAVTLNRADLLIHGGMGLESGWLPPVLIQSRNPKIQIGEPGNLDASIGVLTLEVPSGNISRSMGDVHPLGNPHYYLDPRNGPIMAKSIAQKLIRLDPEGEAYYQSQLNQTLTQMENYFTQLQGRAQALRGKKVVTYHKSFTYLANWAGLTVVSHLEPKPGIPPSAKHVKKLQELISAEKIKVIMMETYYPRKTPEFLAKKTGAQLLILPANTSSDQSQAYYKMFDQILNPLLKVFAP